MRSPKMLKRHASLVDRMARTVGVDLEESALRGDLAFDEIADAVIACTGCTNPTHCESWLAEKNSAESTPEYCRNTELLKRLMP
ncbi:DUF6455 family protein [Ruegeria sp. 2205SS24-7]|uniref:DUF6455 family protein n=1 Tax=Ruegeria discodermiae TaxID=3064389 RepID=UPI0027408B5C|nr:DUF6455 family protein [Ruegeria sp. 2205SS24-7]MDP5219283.1 DUF6455 family protein [Ruegeria sp. 2205SS24-7]